MTKLFSHARNHIGGFLLYLPLFLPLLPPASPSTSFWPFYLSAKNCNTEIEDTEPLIHTLLICRPPTLPLNLVLLYSLIYHQLTIGHLKSGRSAISLLSRSIYFFQSNFVGSQVRHLLQQNYFSYALVNLFTNLKKKTITKNKGCCGKIRL